MAKITSIEKLRTERTIRTVLEFMRSEFDKHRTVSESNQTIREAFQVVSDAARGSLKYSRRQIDEQLAYLADQFKIAQ